jgi:hypothetical protein
MLRPPLPVVSAVVLTIMGLGFIIGVFRRALLSTPLPAVGSLGVSV